MGAVQDGRHHPAAEGQAPAPASRRLHRVRQVAGPATVLNDIVWLRQACLGAVAR
ncbi:MULTISPECIES: hypothetical protein [Comamonas]|uniref:hypothetical protein n=1 Tax=Comamonas TaxID=283 RepID=UPI00031B9721|nr:MULTISPECIES: hypothetical protein [Comamonas]